MLSCKSNGIFYEKRVDLPFLSYGSLFLSMKNDINFVFLKNLFNHKAKSSEKKIHEFLARIGISIKDAEDSFMNMNEIAKKQVVNYLEKQAQ